MEAIADVSVTVSDADWLAVPVIGANPAYHQWVISETREPSARDQRGPAQ